MPSSAWIVFAAAAALLAATAFLLVWRRGLQSLTLTAGPVKISLSAVDVARKVEQVHAELLPNGGASARDAINRIEAAVVALSERMSALEDAFTQPKEER